MVGLSPHLAPPGYVQDLCNFKLYGCMRVGIALHQSYFGFTGSPGSNSILEYLQCFGRVAGQVALE
eukprot:4687025-Amphidinium_carterae.1